MIDMWDLMAPLWNCDGPLERVGWFLDGGAVQTALTSDRWQHIVVLNPTADLHLLHPLASAAECQLHSYRPATR
jgi:hypothetical protein